MATATMGLRRRVSGASNSPVASTSSKRSRADNNNSPSQGNLNSPNGPPLKKSRGSSALASKNYSAFSSTEVKHKMPKSGKSGVLDPGISVLPGASWPTDPGTYMPPNQALLGMPAPIPYMSTSMATFVGTATNLKSSSMSYLDISNMTSSSLGTTASVYANSGKDPKSSAMGYPPVPSGPGPYTRDPSLETVSPTPNKFLNDTMFNTYQPWVIKTYGDLAKTKTITIKKYARILRTLRGEEVNSAENSKFRFWVKSKGFHIGQPEGYDAKPADRIIGRHAVTNPGLDPPLYVPTQLPHNKVGFCFSMN